jgi:acetyl esterase/lipase
MDTESTMPSQFRDNRKKAIRKLSHLIYSPKREPQIFRTKLDEAFYSPYLPQRVECDEFFVDHIACEMLSPRAYIKNRIILYVHGGSFLGGSSKAWRTFCASFANECVSRLVIPNYRLAPTYAFPMGLEDVQKVFHYLCQHELEKTQRPPDFIIASDGAGASLALALALNLKEKIRTQVKQVVLFSPWLDLSSASILYTAKKNSDEILNSVSYKKSAESYTYLSNVTNPFVSPIYASEQDLQGFPPVYIQMGEKEILLADAKRFCQKLEAASVPYELDVWDDMMHLFQMADEYLSESHLAVQRVGNYIRKKWN